MDKINDLIVALYDVGAVKFGSFTLKSGIQSPIYFDLRVIISHPKLMQSICEILEDVVGKINTDVICGVPYTALPLATVVSINKNIPMIIKRKEQKKYGTAKLIEGEYTEGKSKCLILEDVVTTGSSIIETTQALRDHGILVDQAIVVINRNYPAVDDNLSQHGISLTSLIKVDQLLQVLLVSSRITSVQKGDVETFLSIGQTIPPLTTPASSIEFDKKQYQNELASKLNAKAKQLVDIIIAKESNLCISADCESWQEILDVVEAVGSKICAVKTHIDVINFSETKGISTFTTKLMDLATTHNFIIIEDRKFGDIGSTVEKQLVSNPYTISEWANFVTVHSIPGPGMLQVFQKRNKGVILIAEMSSTGNLPSLLPQYKEKTLEICQGYEDTVVGFVSQSRVGSSLKNGSDGGSKYFLQFTPGVSLHSTGDSLGQQYVSVKDAILEKDADIIIVGRGILQQGKDKWVETAEQYRQKGWEAFRQKYM